MSSLVSLVFLSLYFSFKPEDDKEEQQQFASSKPSWRHCSMAVAKSLLLLLLLHPSASHLIERVRTNRFRVDFVHSSTTAIHISRKKATVYWWQQCKGSWRGSDPLPLLKPSSCSTSAGKNEQLSESMPRNGIKAQRISAPHWTTKNQLIEIQIEYQIAAQFFLFAQHILTRISTGCWIPIHISLIFIKIIINVSVYSAPSLSFPPTVLAPVSTSHPPSHCY